MALEKITEAKMNANGVVAAPDILNGTAAENKAIFDRMVRNLVAPAYNACVDVVNELTDTNAGIKENEAQRETAEQSRAEAEARRETAEQERKTAEQDRADAESARQAAEKTRAAAEEDRKAAETERANAEANRTTAEQTREAAEANRAAAETEREQAFTVMQNRIEQLSVEAETLQAETAATAEVEVDPATGGYKITLGIPKGKDGEGGGTGDMLKTTYDPRGKAQDVFKYAEDKASAAVKAHNESEEAHPDIRALIENAGGAGEGTQKFYGTIGTAWTEDSNTGAKYQLVAIEGVTADMELGRLDTINTHDRTSEGYAAYVEEQNQFLTYITNGDAETVEGGVMFYIYGEANTVAIPFGLVV